MSTRDGVNRFLQAVIIWSAWNAVRLLGADTVVMPDGERLPFIKMSFGLSREIVAAARTAPTTRPEDEK